MGREEELCTKGDTFPGTQFFARLTVRAFMSPSNSNSLVISVNGISLRMVTTFYSK